MNSLDDLYNYFFNNTSCPFYLENFNINNLKNIIYLTEDGFSDPVGVYDSKTKTAKLTKSIIDKTLVITISDIIFNGNNHYIKNNFLDLSILIKKNIKNISIENLSLNSSNVDAFIESFCENINFRNCIFKGENLGIISFLSINVSIESCDFKLNNTGILLFGCKDSIIKSNNFISNEKGVYLFENNNNANIVDNLFLDCFEGVLIYSKNNFNIIDSNTFKNENNILKQYAVSMLDNNNYNRISKNLIIFSNKNITYDIGTISSQLVGIYISGDTNSLNTISKNKLIFKNNILYFNNTHPIISIIGIYSYGNNSDLEISYNQIDIINNEFYINKGNSPYLYLNSIYLSKHSNCVIKNNFYSINNNCIDSKSNNTFIEIINLKLEKYNKSIKILSNEFYINQNISINKFLKPHISNIYLVINNSDSDIKDNIFKINDSNYGCVNSINLYNENYGNKISYNKFIYIDGISIKLENNNSGNLIMYNNINANNFAIVLNDGNNSNIIKENSLSTISSSSILLLINNLSNLISENYIENELLGIFLLNDNTFNSISFNEFSKTSQDISNINNSYNYIFNNTKYVIEDNKKL